MSSFLVFQRGLQLVALLLLSLLQDLQVFNRLQKGFVDDDWIEKRLPSIFCVVIDSSPS